ncbi:potassium voltage-gated channel Shaker-related subfamily A member 5 [Mariprofundus micogutta]|uniref:Potassium voltage-gated channel Shaker-related subfamily A member 5 n=1 Tax=Mariprofundus micogutta TaxID=1921010 RepID=A0A1L8CK90_9PROT|nr:potassium channel family protein [Mariprofundus micogutta]GAV19295.1 potassium voltage-gated channel Shaker-related subfamily A member 5 [Mariprofundus micogutta]
MTQRLLWQRVLDVALFAATIGAVATSFVDGLPEWTIMAVLVAFVIMFFTRWWIADNRSEWMKANWFDLVVVVLLSSPFLRMLMALRLAHLIPALKLGALVRSNKDRLLRLLVISGDSLPAAMATMFGLVFVFGTITFLLEHGQNPQFAEFPDGLWWAFVTLTTVGYGDIVPITSAGRIIAVMTMIFGIIVYSLVVANLTVFLEEYGHKHAEEQKQPAEAVEEPVVIKQKE